MTDQLPEVDMLLQAYLPSTRTIGGSKAPVLIKVGQLGGNYLPPVRVYLASDVDKELARLREQIRVLQLRDDYVTACLV